jgi:hypothetical protein
VQVTREKRAKNKQTRVHRCLVRMGPRARGTSPSLSASVLRDFREHSANTATTIANPHLASTGYVSSRKTDISASASQVSSTRFFLSSTITPLFVGPPKTRPDIRNTFLRGIISV